MSPEQQLIEAFVAARAAGDVPAIVACVAADLRWERNGFPVAHGSAAFRTRLTAELPTGRARSSVDQLFEGPGCGFTVGGGRLHPVDGGPARPFTRVEAFVIDDGRISVLRTTDSAVSPATAVPAVRRAAAPGRRGARSRGPLVPR